MNCFLFIVDFSCDYFDCKSEYIDQEMTILIARMTIWIEKDCMVAITRRIQCSIVSA